MRRSISVEKSEVYVLAQSHRTLAVSIYSRHKNYIFIEGKFGSSGIYQVTCPNCKMKYTGQTGGSFEKRFKEPLIFIQE